MAKPQYGSAHQKERREALAVFIEGTPCRYCRRPMHRWQALDLDHIVPVAMGGTNGPTRLVHAKCNRSAGASLGNRMRGKGGGHVEHYRIGDYVKRDRNCEICGQPYHAHDRWQRTCGRTCGVELKRRNDTLPKSRGGPKPRVYPRKQRTCIHCGTSFLDKGRTKHCVSCLIAVGLMRDNGNSWSEVANLFGFASEGAAFNAVNKRNLLTCGNI